MLDNLDELENLDQLDNLDKLDNLHELESLHELEDLDNLGFYDTRQRSANPKEVISNQSLSGRLLESNRGVGERCESG